MPWITRGDAHYFTVGRNCIRRDGVWLTEYRFDIVASGQLEQIRIILPEPLIAPWEREHNQRLPEATPRVVLTNLQSPRPADLLQAILFDLNLPYRGLSEQELRLAVTEHLLAQTTTGGSTVLLIDEAQNLGSTALEEIRLLGNIESQGGTALFTLLVAQPRIQELLKHPECGAFAQRIGAKCHVEPFTLEESVAYLQHQLQAAVG